jgi:hypothetical protein
MGFEKKKIFFERTERMRRLIGMQHGRRIYVGTENEKPKKQNQLYTVIPAGGPGSGGWCVRQRVGWSSVTPRPAAFPSTGSVAVRLVWVARFLVASRSSFLP